MSEMKKSRMYRLAALAVLKDDDIAYDETIDIICELGAAERSAKYGEKMEAEKAAKAAE